MHVQNLTFLASFVVLEEEKDQVIKLGYIVNDVPIFDERGESETWSSSMLNQRSLRIFGDALYKAVQISHLHASS